MSTYHGKDGVAYSGTNSIGELVEFRHRNSISMDEDTAKGDTKRSRLVGYKDGEGSITVHADAGNLGQADLVEGATLTLKLYPEGESGTKYLTDDVIIESIEWSSPREGIAGATIAYRGYLTPTAVT